VGLLGRDRQVARRLDLAGQPTDTPLTGIRDDPALVVLAIGKLVPALRGGLALRASTAGNEQVKEEAVAKKLEEEHEVEQAERAVEASDPNRPHGFEEIMIAHPENEAAAGEQVAQQIQTNLESQDPTHQQEASCTIGTSYRNYSHFLCIA
jgi:hypothetical protein